MHSVFSASVSGSAMMPATCCAKSVLGSTGADVCAVLFFDFRAIRPSPSARFGDAFSSSRSKDWSKGLLDLAKMPCFVVSQRARSSASEAEGCRFDPCRGYSEALDFQGILSFL